MQSMEFPIAILVVVLCFTVSTLGAKVPDKQKNESSNIFISFSEFRQAVTTNGYPAPSQAQYNSFMKGLPMGKISSKREAAMALAQMLRETGGLQFKSEWACRPKGPNPGCAGRYTTSKCDIPGKRYFGRGYLQMTWCKNYRNASRDLGLGDELVRNPEKVANDEDLAWSTAFWYWRTYVHNRDGVQQGQFHSTTLAINGGECCPKHHEKVEHRFKLYSNVFQAFKLKGRPNKDGCIQPKKCTKSVQN